MARAGPEGMNGGKQTDPMSLEQRQPLLRTKLFLPPIRPNRVDRPRLSAQITAGLDKALILVSAPAGYGKTTLVSGWLRETRVPSTWLSLDEGDNDPIRFLQNFIASLQKIIPGIPSDLLGVLQGTQPAPYEALLNILINEITENPAPFVLVLDDFHVIHAQPILDMLAFLIEHVPSQMHLALLSRTDPPLPIFRLHARDQLVEIRANQLRFTNEEITVFLNDVMGLKLSADDIIAMEARTEGWIAGLQLASIAMQSQLSMQGSKNSHSFVTEFTGSHYYIMDYLTEEVLKLQPERVRTFLLQTSILTSMCASLCDAVIENRESSVEGSDKSLLSILDSQSILEYLERRNLFVVPLDDKRQWYRYHHLFADVLRLRQERLFPHQLSELHRHASNWYEQNDIIPEATRHALMAGEQRRAAQLVEQHGCSLIMQGEGFTLLNWVGAVESYTQTHPWLAILKAWALALTGRLDDVEAVLQIAEGLFSPLDPAIEVKIMLGSIAAVRAYLASQQGDAHLAVDHAQGALEYLPDSNEFSCSLRSVATSILGDASWMDGNLEGAKQAYLEAVRISQAAGNMYMTMIANSNLADVLTELGELHQAARIYSETLQMATRPDGQKLPLADRIYAGLGKIYYEWNDLEAAAQHIEQCIELCQQWENHNWLAKSYVMLARLERAKCNPEKAREAIRAAQQIASEQRLSPTQSASVNIACARWWIAQGNPERAFKLVQQIDLPVEGIPKDGDIPYLHETEYLLLLRLRMAQGDYQAALPLSMRLLRTAEAAEQAGRVIEILVLQALTFQEMKDVTAALAVLEKALSLAQPDGYTRVFLDEGEPMAKLLFQAKSHRIGNEYASELLSALDMVPGTPMSPAQLMVERLTPRELEVLRLIEAGCSNQDIAEELVISILTVKRHISNIYDKLGVKSRTQAVSLGRELKLFG